jgi:glycosyltransferase involved in cell wall biosynthesis
MTPRKPRVVYWFDIPTPTAIARCNAVAERDELDFEVWFNRRSHDWDHQRWTVDLADARFPYRFVAPTRVLGRLLRVPVATMDQSRLDLIVHDYFPWWMAVGVLASKVTARRMALRVLPNYDAWSHRTRHGELAKNFIFRAIDGAKVPGPDGRALAMKYGLPAERTAVVRQTVDFDWFAPARDIDPETRELRRCALGLSGCVFIFVGRIWSGKGLDDLFDAYARVANEIEDVSLLLLGDGPDDARYRGLAENLPNVVFAGWVAERRTVDYFAVSDAMVFPTLGDPHGLVVEEAMSAGVPVIASDSAGDIRLRIEDGESGFVVPTGDSSALADRMIQVASDEHLRQRLRAAGLETAAQLRHLVYGEDFVAFAQKILGMPRRRTTSARVARGLGAVLRTFSRRPRLRIVREAPTVDGFDEASGA